MNTGAVMLDFVPEFKPGDMPPDGYLAWHEWAEVQRAAGIKQVSCCRCCLWQTPQELSDITITSIVRDRLGKKIEIKSLVCKKCAVKNPSANDAPRSVPNLGG